MRLDRTVEYVERRRGWHHKTEFSHLQYSQSICIDLLRLRGRPAPRVLREFRRPQMTRIVCSMRRRFGFDSISLNKIAGFVRFLVATSLLV